jgi:Spy/CpxP family protein refolding chaperone
MAKTWQVILATIAIFVAGIVTGGATALGVVKWMGRHPRVGAHGGAMFGPHSGQMQPFGPQLMRSFENQLDLNDDQRAKIAPIVKRTSAQLGRQRHEVQLGVALAIEKMQDEIAALLSPDQRTKFEALIAQQRGRLEEFRKARGQWAQQGGPQGGPEVGPPPPPK